MKWISVKKQLPIGGIFKMKKTIKIDINDYNFKLYKKPLERMSQINKKNTELFIQVILDICCSVIPKDKLPKNSTYNIQNISCNQKTNEWFLFHHIDPIAWLNYSPCTDTSLSDWVFHIETEGFILEGDLYD